MDPITLGIIGSIGTGYFTKYSAKAVESLFERVFQQKPELEQKVKSARSTQDVESIFEEAIGIIDAQAGTGTIEVDGALVEAMRGIQFNHEAGRVTISNTTVSAPVLVTGGGRGATGQTNISGTNLKSGGTEIRVGKNASIKLSGNARIIQK